MGKNRKCCWRTEYPDESFSKWALSSHAILEEACLALPAAQIHTVATALLSEVKQPLGQVSSIM